MFGKKFRSRSREPVEHDTLRPLAQSPESDVVHNIEPVSPLPRIKPTSELPPWHHLSASSLGLTLSGRGTKPRYSRATATTSTSYPPNPVSSSSGLSPNPLGLNIVHDPVVSVADLIFVHGLGGGSRKTWSWEDNPDLYWPSWLQHEQGLSNFRIFSYGYNANWREPGTPITILDFSKGLLACMHGFSGPGVKPVGSQPIIFIAHSMGGLVVKRAYVASERDKHYKEMMEQVRGIIFLSTPHRGSSLAPLLNLLAATLGVSPKVYLSELGVNSPSIENLTEDFRGVCNSLQLVSFYETLPTKIPGGKKMIVGSDSGCLNYPDEILCPLNANHHTVCKYSSLYDENYVIVRGLLRQLSKGFETQLTPWQPPSRADNIKLLENILGIQESPEDDLSKYLRQGTSGSCQWLQNRQSFQDWRSCKYNVNKILWLSALPGTGKSTLAGITIDYLQKIFSRRSCQYHFFGAQNTKRNVTYCLRSIVFQLACTNDIFAARILQLHKDTGIAFESAKTNSLWENIFERIVFKMDFGYVLYWVFDGLDEADAPIVLAKSLMQMQSQTCIKLLFLSRPTKDLSNLATSRGDLVTYETISATDTMHDIRSYVQAIVHESCPNDDKFEESVINQVLEKAEGSFLWTKLALNTFRDNWHTQKGIQRVLNDFPKGMESIYRKMLQLIETQAPRLHQMAIRILTWAACSSRALMISELEVALSPEFEGFVSLGDTIIQICGHFIRVDNNTISLIHTTARQFLLSSFMGQPPIIEFHMGHELLATACIRFLSDDRWRRVLTQTLEVTTTKVKADPCDRHPFLRYAKENWAFHVSHSTHDSKTLLLLLRTFFEKHVLSWIHAAAASNSLRSVTHSAQYLTVFLRKRKRKQPLETLTSLIATDTDPRENEDLFLKLWIIDLIRIVGRFGSNLIQNPSTIYGHVPPLCPRDSIIAQTYDIENESLISVKGISSRGWDDNLARLTVGQDEMVSKVLCAGAYFITLISTNGTLVIWYAETCEEVRRICHQEYTVLICINKSGNLIASAGRFTFRIWDISTGDQLYSMSKDTQSRLMSLNFGHSDSELLVGYDDCSVVTYDLSVSREVRRFIAEEAGEDDHSCPRLMVMSPDLTRLAIAYRGRPVLLWDMTSAVTQLPLRCIRTEDRGRWDKKEKEVWNAPEVVRWHPEGASLFILYQDTTLVDWRPIEDKQFEYGHTEAREMVLDHDGTLLLTCDNSGTLSVWTVPRFNLVYRLCYEEFVRDLAFSPDGQRIYDTRGTICNVWEPDALVRAEELDRDGSSISCDSSFVSEPVYAEDDNERSQITSLAGEFNDEFFCCGRDDGTVSLHEMSHGKKVRKLYSHASTVAVIALAWSPSGRFLVSGDDSGKITAKRLGIKNDGRWAVYPVFDFRIDETVEQFLFSPNEEKLLISTTFVDRVWSIKEKREICKKRWSSKSGRKWVNYPLEENHILWIDPNGLYIHDWETLQRAVTQQTSIIVEQREGVDQKTISTEGLPCLTLTKPNGIQEAVHTVAQTSNRRYVICETLPDTGHTRSNSTTDLRLDIFLMSDVKQNPVKRKNLVQLAKDVQRLIGCYRDRMVFLDQRNWLCTWEINRPANEFKRHFFLPKDWLNVSDFQLVSLNKQGTLLCPRNGEVAIVRYNKAMW